MTLHMTHRLGEILVEKGFITSEQLYAAINQQKKHRQRLAAITQAVHLTQQPAIFTAACANEIQRAHRENQNYFFLPNVSTTHRENINLAANDANYEKK